MLNNKPKGARLLSLAVALLALLVTPGPAAAQEAGNTSSPPRTSTAAASPQAPSTEDPAALAAEVSTKGMASEDGIGQPAGPAQSGAKKMAQPPACKNTVKAGVVAIAQPYSLNRLGAMMPNAAMFALESDVEAPADGSGPRLKGYKRARPIVLRANVGDCLQITLKNWIKPFPASNPPEWQAPFNIPGTPPVSIHVQGMELVDSINSDGSFVGANDSGLVTPSQPNPPQPVQPGQTRIYNLYASQPGTFLLYSLAEANTTGQQVQYYNQTQYLMIEQLALGLIGAVNVQPETAEWYRSQLSRDEMDWAIDRSKGNNGFTAAGQPILNYDAVYPASDPYKRTGPIIKMTDANGNLVHSDLTAIITGPNKGRFAGVNGADKEDPPCSLLNDHANKQKVDPNFCKNPAYPDRKQPYREITAIYHEVSNAAQAFPIFSDRSQGLVDTLGPGLDSFAINYGTGGIGAEVYANRVKVGPSANCIDCKYEEFFLSSWALGDPAMVVDVPANTKVLNPSSTLVATKAKYPDDPTNVYHSYLGDHVIFRVLHGGNGITHVHHQHAGQWLQTPNSDQGNYLDSQMISPGASYSLEMVYNGSGNLNKTAGDWIYHCHFYPHFAGGMWALWRVHDVFEMGTKLDASGVVAGGWNRALPDGEIVAGTPIPAIVPMPTIAMAPMPAQVKICKVDSNYNLTQIVGADCPQVTGATVGTIAVVNKADFDKGLTPGFPFFVPGIAGWRAPHPPMDFAYDIKEGEKEYLDGGLPRHVATGGTVSVEKHTQYDWTKDVGTMNAVQLPEEGTVVEQLAMKYFGTRIHSSFKPDNTPASFRVNGLPRKPAAGYTAQNQWGSQLGAPFADPGVDLLGNVAGGKQARRYKGAAFQLDVTFNTTNNRNWHFPQQRILSLWEDVMPTKNYSPASPSAPNTRAPEPLFIRANSGEVVEFWHTNLVPNYYEVDDFQVRTPTDIIGQHIHLVKFDVMTADGAANGFNYEDGTFSPGEVQELVHAINKGKWNNQPGNLSLKPPPKEITKIDCPPDPTAATAPDLCKRWAGAQTTVQRWYADPLTDNKGTDRTIGTVFTHDHFGPSTHQQAGLYAGLLTEPTGSTWKESDTGKPMGGAGYPLTGVLPRLDGGPTSWKADIIAGDGSFREFALEFQDFQLAYSRAQPSPSPWPNPDPSIGYRDPRNAVNAPATPGLISSGGSATAAFVGAFSLNYRNSPLLWRVGQYADLSDAFNSTLKLASNSPANGDPQTPLMRAYQNDPIKIRTLVGAHQMAHFFTMHGAQWLEQPAWKNSGYRSTQAMGLSEHNELMFKAPGSTPQKVSPCPDTPYDMASSCYVSDHLYIASTGDNGLTNGLWGIFRAYDPTKKLNNLQPLPNNPLPATAPAYATCPQGAKTRLYDITAIDAQTSMQGGTLTFNSRGAGATGTSQLNNPVGILYVLTADLNYSKQNNVPLISEPLILRANAGECINITLRNGISPAANVLGQQYQLIAPFNELAAPNTPTLLKPSKKVGLHAQLLSYDVTTSDGVNAGYNSNPNQVAAVGGSQAAQYRWYAGLIERNKDWTMKYTPVEFGPANLTPSDPLLQHINGLYGAIIIEPENSQWMCDTTAGLGKVDCYGADALKAITSRASATVSPKAKAPAPQFAEFREFVVMVTEDLKAQTTAGQPPVQPFVANSQSTFSAINYKSEPTFYRFGSTTPDTFNTANGDNECSLSNRLVGGDPQTPVFTAQVGTPVRFRMLHPPGSGIVQVFTINGHVYRRYPYVNNSKKIGDNKLTQWIGSLDNLGATAHYDLLIDRAGGRYGVPGDYLYSAFVPAKSEFGMWGIFRVLDQNGQVVRGGANNPNCPPPASQPAATKRDAQKDRLDRFRIKPATKQPNQ